MTETDPTGTPGPSWTTAITTGVVLGLPFGILMDNLAIGIAIGIALGIAMAGSSTAPPSGDEPDAERESRD